MNEIDQKIARGAAWMVSFKLADRGLGILSTIVLVRLLHPSDFGLVAMAMLLIGALQLLVSFNFDVPLIQNPETGRAQLDTAWTLNLLFVLLCATTIIALANPAAQFYDEPKLQIILYVLAMSFFLEGFTNIGPVLFRREMQFKKEFYYLLSKRIASLFVAIPLAYWFRNYWALVIGQITNALLTVLISYIVSNYRPKLSIAAKTELFSSSKWLIINNLLNFLNGRVPDFIVGRITGAQALGIYRVGSEISTLPTTELVSPINRAAFPGYTRLARTPDLLAESFLNVFAGIAIFVIPAAVGVSSLASSLVPVLLGEKWIQTIPVIQIIAIYGGLQALQTNIGYVYMALGRYKTATATGAAQFFLLVILIFPMVYKWGAAGAAYASLASLLVITPINQYLLFRYLKITPRRMLRRVYRPILASGGMAYGIWTANNFITLSDAVIAHAAMKLIVCFGIGIALYSAFIYILWRIALQPRGPELIFLTKLEGALRKFGININLFSKVSSN